MGAITKLAELCASLASYWCGSCMHRPAQKGSSAMIDVTPKEHGQKRGITRASHVFAKANVSPVSTPPPVTLAFAGRP